MLFGALQSSPELSGALQSSPWSSRPLPGCPQLSQTVPDLPGPQKTGFFTGFWAEDFSLVAPLLAVVLGRCWMPVLSQNQENRFFILSDFSSAGSLGARPNTPLIKIDVCFCFSFCHCFHLCINSSFGRGYCEMVLPGGCSTKKMYQ